MNKLKKFVINILYKLIHLVEGKKYCEERIKLMEPSISQEPQDEPQQETDIIQHVRKGIITHGHKKLLTCPSFKNRMYCIEESNEKFEKTYYHIGAFKVEVDGEILCYYGVWDDVTKNFLVKGAKFLSDFSEDTQHDICTNILNYITE